MIHAWASQEAIWDTDETKSNLMKLLESQMTENKYVQLQSENDSIVIPKMFELSSSALAQWAVFSIS